jgi:hypothetical protein
VKLLAFAAALFIGVLLAPHLGAQERQPTLCTHCGSDLTPAERAERDQVLIGVLDKAFAKLNTQLSQKPDTVSTRDLTNGALYSLQRGQDAVAAETLLRKLFSVQNMDSSSPDFGNIQWTLNNPQVKDANAIEFDMQAMGAIFRGYGNRLSPGFRKDAEPHLRAALNALAHHQVQVSYTNIFLMNTLNTLELGEYLNDDAALARGRQQWAAWRDYTAHYGIHEFDSPTYYGVDMGDLVLGFHYVKDPLIHQQISDALVYFWKDIAARYFPPAERLAGAHARDYNFLMGFGGLDFSLFAEGILNDQAALTDVFLEKCHVLENDRPGGFHPSREMLQSVAPAVRTVEQHFDEAPERENYTYITPDFAMGTSEGSYGPQDKMFAADVASPASVPSITMVVDAFGSPYGLTHTLDGSGHSKPMHLPPNLSSVQKGSVALLAYDLNPSRDFKNASVGTNMILPAAADELLLDGERVTVSNKLDLPAHPGSVVALRLGHACFAAKLLSVDDLQGTAAQIHLKADDLGLEHGALRLLVDHGKVDRDKGPANHLHVVWIVAMRSCSDHAGLSNFASQIREPVLQATGDSKAWTAQTSFASTHLSLTEDLSSRLPSVRAADGHALPSPIFAVNGNAVPF